MQVSHWDVFNFNIYYVMQIEAMQIEVEANSSSESSEGNLVSTSSYSYFTKFIHCRGPRAETIL